MTMATASFRKRRCSSVLALAIASALGLGSAGAATQALELRSPPRPPFDMRAAGVDRIAVEVERDGLPADGQTPAKLRIRLFDRQGRPLQADTMVTVEASAGRLQAPGADSDEAGLAPRDADRVMPGMQVVVHDGQAEVWLLAPVQAQSVDVQVSAGAAVAKGRIAFLPELRDMLAVGVVDGIVDFDHKNPFSLQQARPDDGFEARIDSWSRSSGDGKRNVALRSAFFLKGQVATDTLLTMAYDSDKPGNARLFRDLDPERWFPVNGDASMVGFEARSNSRLYLRLDRQRNYLMYGDIATGDGFSQRAGQGEVASGQVRDLGQYTRTLTGVRGHLEGARGTLDAFAADDHLRQVVEEFPGRGLSGPYTVSNSTHAVLGSEQVQIVVRDRDAPSRILQTTPMVRFSDYTFEPFSGRILFTRPVPSVDESLNPVSVRITYEVDQGGENYWVYGLNGQYKVLPALELGGSYVKDQNPLAPFELASVNGTLQLGEQTWLRGEYARTESALNSANGTIYTIDPFAASGRTVAGDAWRAEFGHRDRRSSLLAWYGQSDANFNNPASSYLGGRRQAGLDAKLALGGDLSGDARSPWELYAKGTWIADRLSAAERSQAQVGVRYAPDDAFSVEIGANHVDEHAGNGGLGNGLSLPGNLGAPYGVGLVTPGIGGGIGGGFAGGMANALDPGSGQTLYNTGAGWSGNYGSWVGNGLAGVPVEYTALRLATRWRPLPRLDLSGEVEQDVAHRDHRRAAFGVGYQVHAQTRLYTRYEWNTGLSTVATSASVVDPATGQRRPSPYDSNAFVFGLDTQYMEGGTVFNEYRMYDSFGARQAQWASGVRNLWHLGPTLTLQTGAERLEALEGQTQRATSATVAVEWRPDELWLLNQRLEWRRTGAMPTRSDTALPSQGWLGGGYDSWLSTSTAARKLSRDWTVLARNYYLRNDYDDTRQDSYEDRFQFGLAYRDTDRNRFNLLGKYEYWTRRDADLSQWLAQDQLLAPSGGYDKHVVAVVADWHPNRVWWWTARVAGKRQSDRIDGRRDRYTAYLLGGRGTYGLSERWDVSAMAYRMWSPGGAAQSAQGLEVGYLLTANLWLSAGWNWRGFRDDDMVGAEYTNQGGFLRLRFKFDEDLFRGKDPVVNPALPR